MLLALPETALVAAMEAIEAAVLETAGAGTGLGEAAETRES